LQQPVEAPYRGRFAPSPTGPLHFGSLVAALASFADARAHDGAWLVRMEDLDGVREVAGAANDILCTLEALGFEWDGPILYQSTHREAYAEALSHLGRQSLTFPCVCSRKEIAQAAQRGPEGPIYPGTCRNGVSVAHSAQAIRLRAQTPPIGFHDRIQGEITQDLSRDVGDFVLRRADGMHAYQLAVVVDDAFQHINQVVRGADLIRSTPRQILLQRHLGLTTPAYAHVPLALDRQGNKLSKSNAAAPIDARNGLPALLQAWAFLCQATMEISPANLDEFWGQAITGWNPACIPAKPSAQVPPQ